MRRDLELVTLMVSNRQGPPGENMALTPASSVVVMSALSKRVHSNRFYANETRIRILCRRQILENLHILSITDSNVIILSDLDFERFINVSKHIYYYFLNAKNKWGRY